MFLKLKYIFNSKLINNFWMCSPVQTINSVSFSRLLKYSLSSSRVLLESKDEDYQIIIIIPLAILKR